MSWWLVVGVVLVALVVLGLMAGVGGEEEDPPGTFPSDVGPTTVDDDWRELVAFYRQLGFFEGLLADVRPDHAVATVRDAARRTWMRDLRLEETDVEWMVLALDPERVWWSDRRLEVGPGEQTYVETLAAWARIARGGLRIDDVAESWESLMGPVRVTFRHEDDPVLLLPEVRDRFLDLGILSRLNQRLASAGLRFWSLPTGGRTVALVALTDAEARAFRARGVELDDVEALAAPRR
ncbi:MAG: hypothetical protein H6732_06420 [Alphaproteobacteria bacterium]|nr:hypothetical protein [Alphaproteobacteria bacterium]